MTKTAAARYVAQIKGLQNDATALALATNAIDATYQKWNTLTKWLWCLRDTASGFTVTVGTIAAAVVNPVVAGDLDGVNVGVTVTGAGVVASTTVLSFTRDASGHIASLTLSASGPVTGAALSFSGDIPLVSGTNEYNVPTDFNRPHETRLLVNKRRLDYWAYHLWNKRITDHTLGGVPEVYTLFNPLSEATQGFTRLRLFYVPNISDTLHIQYFRRLNPASTNIDIIDEYLYVFLDDARSRFLLDRDSEDSRGPALAASVTKSLNRILAHDQEQSDDEESRLISQQEAPAGARVNFEISGGYVY